MKRLSLWGTITQTLFKGCLLLLPLLISFYLFMWIIRSFDGLFKNLLVPFLSEHDIKFGVGIGVGIIFIYLVGMTSQFLVVQTFESWVEKMIKKIPLVGSVYNSLKDIAGYINSIRTPNAHGRSVIVTFSNSDFKIAGFLTREDLTSLPTDDNLSDRVAVYIPLAYMVGGGFTIFVRRDQVHDLHLPFDRAMQMSLTAWMTTLDQDKAKVEISSEIKPSETR